MKRIIFFVIAISSMMVSCRYIALYDKNLTLLKVTELSSAKVSDSALVSLLKETVDDNVQLEYTLSEDSALQRLVDKKVDLVIIPNNTVCNDASIRTVAPLLPRILVVLAYHVDQRKEKDMKTLLEEVPVVMYEDMSRIDSIFFNRFYQSYGIDPGKINGKMVNTVRLDEWKDSTLVFIGLTHMHNPVMKKLVDWGADFISLDEVAELGHGSSVEGFILNYPDAIPYVLPKDYYKGKPEKPVLTVSIPDILVARRDEPPSMIFDIVKSIVENRTRLIEMDNIYSLLRTRTFLEENFSYPLHNGTIDYLNRDEPTILTRYAAIIWPFISIIAILGGGLASLKRRMRMRKKVSIESFYRRLLSYRKRFTTVKDKEEIGKILSGMKKLRSEAFDALMDDKLMADETFSIFLSLYGEVYDEIRMNMNA